MTRRTKRAQVEALGWKLEAVPRQIAAGLLSDSRTGYVSPAFEDHKHPAAWIVTAPPGRNLPPRRFEGCSPNPAVRWAYDQAMAPEPTPAAGGVAGLALLMASAGRSGVVAEGGAEPASPTRPDAELLSLCREVAGCDRIAAIARGSDVSAWDEPVTFRAAQDRLSEAMRDKAALISRVIELKATTPAGALAKARVVAGLFETTRGQRAAAVRALLDSLEAVLQPRSPQSDAT